MHVTARRRRLRPHARPVLAGLLGLLAYVAVGAAEEAPVYARDSGKSFDEVMFDLEFAITNRNYRLTSRNDIGEAIVDRGNVGFPRATVLHFCNLTDAQQLLELAPDYLVHMPCRVSVRQHGDRVVVETRLLPEDHPAAGDVSKRINGLLRAIVADAVQ